MSPTINELNIEVTTNNLSKMQYFHLFDRIDIVLDQCPKQINIRLPYCSFFKFKASPGGLTIKKEGWGEAWRMCNPHEQCFSGQ